MLYKERKTTFFVKKIEQSSLHKVLMAFCLFVCLFVTLFLPFYNFFRDRKQLIFFINILTQNYNKICINLSLIYS